MIFETRPGSSCLTEMVTYELELKLELELESESGFMRMST